MPLCAAQPDLESVELTSGNLKHSDVTSPALLRPRCTGSDVSNGDGDIETLESNFYYVFFTQDKSPGI